MQIKHGQLKFGLDNLLKASCLDTSNVQILIKLGEGYLMYEEEEGSVDDAIATLERGLQIDPMNYDVTISLAKAYEKK
jgi:Tfp pilus assembly protein PilF